MIDLQAQNKSYWPTEELFDCLIDTVFFVKDMLGKYVVVNETLVRRCGLKSKSDLIGRKPSDLQGHSLGADYEAQDDNVLSNGVSIVNQLELHTYPNRSIGWCMTNKYPLYDDKGGIVGLAGISQDLRAPDKTHDDYDKLKSVVEYVEHNLNSAPCLGDLCRISNLSQYQLDRRMRQVFGLTTGQWVLKMRLDYASQQLQLTDIPIVQVASNIGYEDQSAFSRQFRRATGFSPLAFRKFGKR
ncbi:AraC family transcriptional regulator [Kordiimonas sp. SCSIO 12610]|uniref:AraC family transcriptional regulator n=1 Tax=Kordiimonas sp. SCSIO 12610 TaxID=2829597 RepID=UPI00210AB90C|nr:AraC family transcriptional regulator [Kordiimonas sp. SCSIO 12610]UTW54750.1 AraC family transcriptional regulator [Kordiimonas sp. SCSIO 12610]